MTTELAAPAGLAPARADGLRVLRLCSVFETPPEVLTGRGRRFDPVGGMQLQAAALTRALDARGVAQVVVTTRPPGAPARHRLGRATTVQRLGLPVARPRQLYALPALRCVHARARGASLVHAHLGEDLAVVPIALSAARRHGLPLVLTVHLSLAHTLVGVTPRARALRLLGAPLERAGVRAADAVIALVPRTAELLVADGVDPERVHVVPSGVVVPAAPASTDAAALAGAPRPRVLFVGRLAPQKGVRTLIEAVPRLPAEAEVCVVGDGPARRGLERAAQRAGVAGRVRFLGMRAPTEVPALLAAADVLGLPSVYEELGSVLLQAMDAGLPIVATRVGGIPDAVGDAALLVPARDPPALAAAVAELLRSPQRRADLSRRARERARHFGWEALADRVLEVYRGVVDARGE